MPGAVPTTDDYRRWAYEVVNAARNSLRVAFVPCVVFEDYKEENA